MPRTPRLAALSIALAVACAENTAPLDGPPALTRPAVERYSTVAESLRVAGADPARWYGYYGLIRILANAGEATPVIVNVDGVDEEFVAMAEQVGGGLDCTSICASILEPARMRMLVAWSRNDPGRVVQLTTMASSSPITRPGPGAEPFATGGTLTYLDGRGGFFTATSGEAALRLISVGDTPCYVQHNYPMATSEIWNPMGCTTARLSVGFTAEASRPAVGGPRENSAAGTHRVAMRLRSIPGGLLAISNPFCPECAFGAFPYIVRPPLDPRSQVLTATLTAQVADSVTLTFTVKNPTSAPVQITHADAQRFDLAVVEAGTGNLVWQWSAGRLFAQMLGTETLAPGGSLVFTGTWTPPANRPPGDYFAEARLVSVDQLATASVVFHRP